ncbi:hypothetical protein LZG04_20520 [Saccharothrix sp. S26]|uniref:hypothetical protein n=1 Tax=Saccharothrix sp. S26 TaxID=2907215 RepID=UPI001F439035|nr:hypothetical protein [Saccharothrix sp. S26]MCE6997168.1 hypothetical protein [Saccharothrix sp. S26]
MTRYPTPDEYMKAVQRPDCFVAEELRGLRLVTHPLYGIPMPAAGTSAVVFKATAGAEAQALRFFTRDDVSSSERYGALWEHFTAHRLESVVALPRWIDDGVRVNGRVWPVVRMQWVEGHTLNRHVDELVERADTTSLSALAGSWRGLVTRIQRAGFAHGDLQHGNVLVGRGGELTLVDFDCSWIERFSGALPPSETGHRNYQPEHRPWGRWMDTFSGLVIYLSLLALAKDPTGWRACHTGENLLLRREDFRPPFDTPPWARLAAIGDPQVDEVAARLQQCCTPGWVARSGLDDLLAPRVTPWWERTPTVVAPTRVPVPAAPPPVTAPVRPPVVAPRDGNWWAAVDPAVRAVPGAARPPGRKRPSVAVVVLVALLAGSVVAGLGEDSELGPALGAVVTLVALVIGLVWRRRVG